LAARTKIGAFKVVLRMGSTSRLIEMNMATAVDESTSSLHRLGYRRTHSLLELPPAKPEEVLKGGSDREFGQGQKGPAAECL